MRPEAQTGILLRRTLVVVGAVVLPKCAACAAGYFALLTGVVAASPEMCGAPPATPSGAVWWIGGPLILALAGLVRSIRQRMSASRGVVR